MHARRQCLLTFLKKWAILQLNEKPVSALTFEGGFGLNKCLQVQSVALTGEQNVVMKNRSPWLRCSPAIKYTQALNHELHFFVSF